MKIDDVYEEYINFTPLTPRTKEMYISCYNIFWKSLIGNLKIDEITYDIAQGGLNTLLKKYKYNTVKIYKCSLQKFLHIVQLKNNMEYYWISSIDIGKPPKKHDYDVNINEFYELIIRLRKSWSKNKRTYEMALWIGFFTGMRISEVLQLNLNDISFDSNEIYITKMVKTPESIRTIYMCNELKSKLLDYVRKIDGEILLPSKDGDYLKACLLSSYIRNFAKPRNYKIHFHSLRELFIKTLIDNNIDFETIRALVGHKNIITILDLYLRSTASDRKNAIDKVYNNNNFESFLKDYEKKA